jgi:N4-gp56 family major capsid protein
MTTTTTSQVAPGTQAFYDRNLLERAKPAEVHGRYGQKRPIAKKSGNQIKFRRYSALAAATTALTEGVTPSGSQLSVTDVTASLAQYGDFITLSDVVDMVNQDPVVTEATDVLGDQAGLTIDQVRRDVLVAGTNVAYANAVANRAAVNVAVTAADLNKAIRFLKNQNAKFVKEGIPPSTGVGTGAIRKAYVAVIHPDVEFDIESITGFKPVSDYPAQMGVMEDEIGAYKNIRFVSSTNAKVFAGAGAAGTTTYKNDGANFDVYATLIFAADAYGVCPLSGEAMQTIVKPLGSAGSADPLDQRSSVGWKAMTTTKILNESWMLRLESAASL